MSLPKLSTPTHTLTIPSTKEKVKYRPFLVKEEKVMMLVKESKNAEEILNATKEVINACTFGVVNPDKLAIFDIEYIFLQLRSKSVGEMIELNMKCLNKVDLPKSDDHPAGVDAEQRECGGTVPFSIDLSKIEVVVPEGHNKSIILDGDIGITFKYPSIDIMYSIEKIDSYGGDIDLIVDLVDNIFEGDNVYDAKDTSREELIEFVESITSKQFITIREQFFDKIPTLEHTVKYTCPVCGVDSEYTFRGITDFF